MSDPTPEELLALAEVEIERLKAKLAALVAAVKAVHAAKVPSFEHNGPAWSIPELLFAEVCRCAGIGREKETT